MRRRIHLGLEGHVAVLVKIADLFLGVRGEPRGVRDKWRAGAAGGTCAMRYDEPRPVWTRLTTTH